MEIKIYIANLGKYNEGELVGKWVTLPVSEEELEDVFVEIKLGYRDEDGDYHHGYVEKWERGGVLYDTFYEEMAIHDYEAPSGIKINEYDSISNLNELAERLEAMPSYDKENVEYLLDTGDYNFEEAMDKAESGDFMLFHDCDDMSDVAYKYYEETGMMNDIPVSLQGYIDWEKVGRDMEIEGSFYRLSNRMYIQIYN
ncbi:antirestriction protein ArdA [Paenibacillus sp. MMO-177]|uniref:antirestriction protein ArdA n=1 Tax=Paenibacillus sp. MMO-177 TaxID=3081289 RepID=UPI003015F800